MADAGQTVQSSLDENALDMFEQAYNGACVLIAQSRHNDAIKLLGKAESKQKSYKCERKCSL